MIIKIPCSDCMHAGICIYEKETRNFCTKILNAYGNAEEPISSIDVNCQHYANHLVRR